MRRSNWPVNVAFGLLILSAISAQVAEASYATPSPDIAGIPQADNSNLTNLEYCRLLSYSLYFYEAQRSGKLPTDNRVSWRHDSAVNDGDDVGLDLTGGYYDAGDHIKFTFPLSWTITSVSWGALEWYRGYEAAQQAGYLKAMLKWGTDWLVKAHPAKDVLYAQVGKGDTDHNYWGPDTGIPYPRPAFSVNSTSRGTDVAASTAAALAAASLVFRQNYNDTSYADLLVSHATDLYTLAEVQPFVKYSDSVSDSREFYASNRFTDDLVWGALWLYDATGNSTYLDKATNYITQFSLTGGDTVINWDDKIGATYVLLAKLTQKNGLDSTKWKQETERYLDAMTTNNCQLTKGGLLYCDGDSDEASLNPALNLALASLLYAPQASSSDKTQQYQKFAMSQIDYLFGKNPMKTPYVVGVHPNSPKNPHHSGAHGGNDISTPKTNLNVIYGAVVGGPKKNDKYSDNRKNYEQSEVALDYNAPFQSLMAYQVINAQSEPFYVNLPPGRPRKLGVLIGLVIGAVILLTVIGVCIWKRKKIAALLKQYKGRQSL